MIQIQRKILIFHIIYAGTEVDNEHVTTARSHCLVTNKTAIDKSLLIYIYINY